MKQIMRMILPQMREFILLNYYPLYHFQRYVDRYGVHHDRKLFRRVYEDIGRYRLSQFRKVMQTTGQAADVPESGDDEPINALPPATFPLEIDNQPPHLRFHKYFFLFYLLRCMAVLFVPPLTETEYRRVLIGVEMWKSEIRIFETTFMFWSLIGFLYQRFSLTKSLLDYKFLAIWRISPRRPDYLRPSALRLTNEELLRLHRYRRVAKWFMHSATGSISILGPLCIIFLRLRTSLYSRFPLPTILWSIPFIYWIYAISTLLYTNLVQFLVVTKYLHIKQRSIMQSLNRCLQPILKWRSKRSQASNVLWWAMLIDGNVRYSHVQSELRDYAQFWRTYLTFIFAIYITLIGLMLYIFIYSNTGQLILVTYGVVFFVNVTILSSIIYYCGNIVKQSVLLSQLFTSSLSHFALKSRKFSLHQCLKINNIGISIKDVKYGFSLLNDYVLSYETFQLLTVNIVLYFMLLTKGNYK